MWNISIFIDKTRKHSSMLRNARLMWTLGVTFQGCTFRPQGVYLLGGVSSWGCTFGGVYQGWVRQIHPPVSPRRDLGLGIPTPEGTWDQAHTPAWTERQTPVKTLPSHNIIDYNFQWKLGTYCTVVTRYLLLTVIENLRMISNRVPLILLRTTTLLPINFKNMWYSSLGTCCLHSSTI